MSYPITDIDGIDGEVAVVLKSVGIRSMSVRPRQRVQFEDEKSLAEKTGFDEKQLLCWANVARPVRSGPVRRWAMPTTAGRCGALSLRIRGAPRRRA